MPMNLHSMLTGGGVTISKIFDAVNNIDLISRMLGGLRGKKVSDDSTNGTPNPSQGWVGFFGKGDERKLQVLLQKIRDEENWEYIPSFLDWHFAGERFQDKLLAFWFASSWRVFVTGIEGSNEALSKVKVNQVKNLKTTSTTTDTEYSTYADSHEPALAHLRLMIALIKEGKERHQTTNPGAPEKECLEAGYEALLAYYRALGVPTMPPKSETDWFEWAKALGLEGSAQLKGWYISSRDYIQQWADEVEAKKQAEGPISRFFRKHLG